MIDAQTRRSIKVSTDGNSGPYIMVPVEQLQKVRDTLREHQIRHWLESGAIAVGTEDVVAIINLGLSGDAGRVQTLLDQAS